MIVKTIAHEVIHAAIFIEVRKLNNGVNPVNTEYASLLQEYRDRSMESSHPIMSKYYVGMIAQTLKEVHQKLGEPQRFYDHLNSMEGFNWEEYYEFLAYEGLDGTPEYDKFMIDKTAEYLNKYAHDAKTNATKTPKCN